MIACSATQATPAIGEVTFSRIDGMQLHYVPAGKFNMGNENGWEGQKPVHNGREDIQPALPSTPHIF
jgi:formylglycine-generating enzyme required for sulfatase activity